MLVALQVGKEVLQAAAAEDESLNNQAEGFALDKNDFSDEQR